MKVPSEINEAVIWFIWSPIQTKNIFFHEWLCIDHRTVLFCFESPFTLSLSLSLSISSESEACVFIINADYGFDKNNSTQVFLIHNQYFYFNSTWSPSLSLSHSIYYRTHLKSTCFRDKKFPTTEH